MGRIAPVLPRSHTFNARHITGLNVGQIVVPWNEFVYDQVYDTHTRDGEGSSHKAFNVHKSLRTPKAWLCY